MKKKLIAIGVAISLAVSAAAPAAPVFARTTTTQPVYNYTLKAAKAKTKVYDMYAYAVTKFKKSGNTLTVKVKKHYYVESGKTISASSKKYKLAKNCAWLETDFATYRNYFAEDPYFDSSSTSAQNAYLKKTSYKAIKKNLKYPEFSNFDIHIVTKNGKVVRIIAAYA